MNLKRCDGFTLIELLVVMTLAVMLTGLGVMSFKGGAGRQLSTSGSRISSMIEMARATAILKRQPVAVVLLAEGDNANRSFTAFIYARPLSDGTGQWNQISRWETLPEGVMVDIGEDSAGNTLTGLLPTASPAVDPPLPSLTYLGKAYSPGVGYGYIIFMGDGSLYRVAGTPTTCVLRLVEGFWQQKSIHYTSANGVGGKSANYFEISLNQATGKAKIIRPD